MSKKIGFLFVMLLIGFQSVFAQMGTITGTVTDEKGNPMPGVSVVIEGTTKGVATDFDGNYSIEAKKGNVLVFSYVGFTTLKKTVGESKSMKINVVLKEDAQQLDDVVVVGYGVQKKRDLTGAISSVDMKDTPVNTYSTISHALAGKASGLQVVQNSAQVGGGATFRIRGAASTGAGNEPLIIIDGFPVSQGSSLGSGTRYNAGSTDNILSSLNPNDIESIEVLKDASSTAIYGSRAGHGVIIVTTKRGKQQKAQVSYSVNTSVQNMKNGYKALTGADYMRQFNRYNYENYLKTHGLDVYKDYVTFSGTVPSYSPTFSEDQIANSLNTDWFDAVTRTGFMFSHNLSINGGSESTQYMASLNYMKHEGIVRNNNMERFAGKINLDQTINKYVKTGLSLNMNRNTFDNVALGEGQFENASILSSAATFNPTLPIYDKNGEYSINPYFTQLPNPVSLLEIIDKTRKERILASGYLQVEPIQSLILKANFGIDRQYEKRKFYLPKTTMYGKQANGQANIAQSDRSDYLMDLTATYSKEFEKHNLTALLGYSFQQFNYEDVSAGNRDFLIDSFKYNNLSAGNYARPSVSSGAYKSALGSYFGRINYSYLSRYLLTLTLRADGASNFNPKHRWGYFPSVSAGWRFSDESFMEKFSDVLSNGKLRISYGETGNSNVGNRAIDLFKTGNNNVFGNKAYTGVYASQLGNPLLTWETTSEYNFGLELGFFRNRISLTMEYFDRTISDLLVTAKPLPSYNEITSIASNIGKTQSKGFEFTLNTVNLASENYEWSTDVTFSFYRDRWKERDPNWKPAAYEKVDDYIRSAFTFKSDGLLQPGEKAPKHQAALLPGQVKLIDQNNDGVLDDKDKVLVGSWDPSFIFGFNNTFRYKRFDLNIYLYGEIDRLRGGSYYESWAVMGYGLVQGRNSSLGYAETWSHDNQSGKYPNILGVGGNGEGDFFWRKISYIRCRNITLGYSIPNIEKIANNIRIYADVNNPFVITNWTGIDPETGGGQYSYPNVTSFSVGVDVKF